MILLVAEHKEGKIKKSCLEAASFASVFSRQTGEKIIAMIPKGAENINQLSEFGVEEIHEYAFYDFLDSEQYAEIIKDIYQSLNANYIVFSNNSLGKSIGGRLSVLLNLGLISNVVQYKSENEKNLFKTNVFSGKAYAWYTFDQHKGIVSVMPHGFGVFPKEAKPLTVNAIDIQLKEQKVRLIERKLIKGKTPLTEADIVVSAGRGMKESSNWTMIEELADILNATTACSRPVADAGWRPHHEHVGQTGMAIRPNVYIAIGISGAIQHLAGVNNSKNIIVINKDPEAPFFKAADYGICGDLFEIIPKLNEALRKAK